MNISSIVNEKQFKPLNIAQTISTGTGGSGGAESNICDKYEKNEKGLNNTGIRYVAVNKKVIDFPYPSSRYRNVFNKKAKDMGMQFQWVSDDKHYNAIDYDELEIWPQGVKKYRISGSEKDTYPSRLALDVIKVLQTVEAERLEKVEACAMVFSKDLPVSLKKLTNVEKKAVELFLNDVKPIINKIEALQSDPFVLEETKWIKKHGDENNTLLFNRFHRDESPAQFRNDESFSLFPFFPDKPNINGMIGSGITMEELGNLTKIFPLSHDIFRPTTILEKEAGGNIKSIPIPIHPQFKDLHINLANALERIAILNIGGQSLDAKLKTQLTLWAKFFKTGSFEDEKAAVQSTIDAGEGDGNLRIHIGPSESYWPDNMKFPYVLQVGIWDKELKEKIEEWKDSFIAIEQSLHDMPNYTPRILSTRGGFADPIYQAVIGGFIETWGVEAQGNNFPCYSYGTEGSNRFLLLEALSSTVENGKMFASKTLAEPLSKKQLEQFGENLTIFIAGHESGHLIGPQRNHITPSGKPMGVVFGEYWGSAEEPKADLTALELINKRYAEGKITKEEKRNLQLVSLIYCFLGMPNKEMFKAGIAKDHSFGRIVQTGYFFKTGALSLAYGDYDKRIKIDFEKLESASHNLWKEIISCQAKGDKERFLRFANDCVSYILDEAEALIVANRPAIDTLFIERKIDNR